jgi:hypothetical protein
LRLPQKTKANKTRGLSVRERILFADKCGKNIALNIVKKYRFPPIISKKIKWL